MWRPSTGALRFIQVRGTPLGSPQPRRARSAAWRHGGSLGGPAQSGSPQGRWACLDSVPSSVRGLSYGLFPRPLPVPEPHTLFQRDMEPKTLSGSEPQLQSRVGPDAFPTASSGVHGRPHTPQASANSGPAPAEACSILLPPASARGNRERVPYPASDSLELSTK